MTLTVTLDAAFELPSQFLEYACSLTCWFLDAAVVKTLQCFDRIALLRTCPVCGPIIEQWPTEKGQSIKMNSTSFHTVLAYYTYSFV